MTLREMFLDSEHLMRELIEHLDQGFLPKVKDLEELSRPNPQAAEFAEVEDVSVRSQSSQVLESERFTRDLCGKLGRYLNGIQDGVTRALNEK